MALLETRQLTAFYGDFQALHGIDTRLEAGETIAIIGANGAGKSTYLKAIAGLLQGPADSVVFDGQPIGSQRTAAIMKLGIALVPEGRRLFVGLTVRENLELGSYRSGARAQRVSWRRSMPTTISRTCASGPPTANTWSTKHSNGHLDNKQFYRMRPSHMTRRLDMSNRSSKHDLNFNLG